MLNELRIKLLQNKFKKTILKLNKLIGATKSVERISSDQLKAYKLVEKTSKIAFKAVEIDSELVKRFYKDMYTHFLDSINQDDTPPLMVYNYVWNKSGNEDLEKELEAQGYDSEELISLRPKFSGKLPNGKPMFILYPEMNEYVCFTESLEEDVYNICTKVKGRDSLKKLLSYLGYEFSDKYELPAAPECLEQE